MNGSGHHKKAISPLEGLLYFLSSLFCLGTLLFFVYVTIPSDPISHLVSRANQMSPQSQLSEENRSLLRERLGLNDSLESRLKHFYTDLFNGSFGTSLWTGESVRHLIDQRLPETVNLILPAFFLFLVLGIFLGGLQAILDGTKPGQVVTSFNTTLYCIPVFSLASGLMRIHLPFSSDFLAILVYLGATTPTLATLVSERLLEEEKQTYAQAARAKGLSRRQLFQRHLLKPCLPVVLSLLPWWWSVILGTAIIVEPIFRISGIGMLSFEAFRNQDIPVLLGISLFLGGGRLLLGSVRDVFFNRLFSAQRAGQRG